MEKYVLFNSNSSHGEYWDVHGLFIAGAMSNQEFKDRAYRYGFTTYEDAEHFQSLFSIPQYFKIITVIV